MDSEKIKVACICEANVVQGLQWALDHDSSLGVEFELIPASLKDIPKIKTDVDMYLFNLDLGQPLPTESLKALAPKPGLIVALHPTPHQLLSVFEVPGLTAFSWNGQTFEEVISRLLDLAERRMESIQKDRLIESIKAWRDINSSWPAQIDWYNPLQQKQATLFLDEKSPLSIGGAQSGCDICLDIPGGYKIAEFLFFDGGWHFRVLQKDVPVSGHFDANNLKKGDHIEVGAHIFHVKAHPAVESVASLLERNQMPGSSPNAATVSLQEENLSLVNLCKRLMIQNRTCELRVQATGKYGSIYFVDGQIEDACSGSSLGRKALLRMLGWENSRWKLSLNQKKEFKSDSINMSMSQFLDLAEGWLKRQQLIAGRAPPPQIKLAIDAKNFFHRQTWTTEEVSVVATLAETNRVFEVVNYCELEDHIVLENLILLRKQGLITVLA